jgi:hypothetical protein
MLVSLTIKKCVPYQGIFPFVFMVFVRYRRNTTKMDKSFIKGAILDFLITPVELCPGFLKQRSPNDALGITVWVDQRVFAKPKLAVSVAGKVVINDHFLPKAINAEIEHVNPCFIFFLNHKQLLQPRCLTSITELSQTCDEVAVTNGSLPYIHVADL